MSKKFTFLVAFGWVLIIIGAVVQIFATVINLLMMQKLALPAVFADINSIFQKAIFIQQDIIENTSGDEWSYAIISALFVVAIVAIGLASFQIYRLKKGQRITTPYFKMLFVVLIIASLVYGKVSALSLAGFTFIGLLFIESSLFDVEALQNYAQQRNMIIVYREDKRFEREVNKEGKYIGSATLKVGASTAEIKRYENDTKRTDYNKEVDNPINWTTNKESLFNSQDINILFNGQKSTVEENELASIISDMSQTETDLKLSDNTIGINGHSEQMVNEEDKNIHEKLEDKKSLQVNESEVVHNEVIFPKPEVKKEQIKAFNTDVETFSVKSELGVSETFEDKINEDKTSAAMLDDNAELFDSSIVDEQKEMSKKQTKIFGKWQKMYQQALEIKNAIKQEVIVSSQPSKGMKKSVKDYNVLVEDTNNLASKLDLEGNKFLKTMYIEEIIGTDSKTTETVFEDIKPSIDEVVMPSFEPIVREDSDFESVFDENTEEIMTTETNYEHKGTIYVPEAHNDSIQVFELLNDVQIWENNIQMNADIKHEQEYSFVELDGLEAKSELDFEKFNEAFEDIIIEEPAIEVEGNNQEPHQSFQTDMIDDEAEEFSFSDEIEGLNDIEDSDIEDFDALFGNSNSQEVELTSRIHDDVFKNDQEETEIIKVNLESSDDVVISTPIKSAEHKVAINKLDEEVSYSLDELDDKITKGDFSNLEDEVLVYSNQSISSNIATNTFKSISDESVVLVDDNIDDNIKSELLIYKNKFDKFEELLQSSITLQSAQTKSLTNLQEHITNLTINVENLEIRTNSLAEKINFVGKNDIQSHKKVIPIDQFYPPIDDLNLHSTRYNLYNKNGYSNTYGVHTPNDFSHSSGGQYRNKNLVAGVNELGRLGNKYIDYNHVNLHNVSKYTKQDIPYEVNCALCKKINK